ncbi:craniofacial development protein 2-like [Diabrotica virgifera virgifera]|uniref:Endonuclease/exonuclease/phosphatase domain-containing protein n=1 Tax=Diabrotica virgifera virgifera TaxID=50390 RepID=A0ABM5KFD6_DIAVI|nr:craniofacial development protein 2-like [Diabrotica virgifera virgifera]
MCFSGNTNKSINGVGFWVSKSLSPYILGYQAISDRIISLKLNGSPSIVHLIQVYAPTSTADDDTTESFFNELESYLQNIPNKEIAIIMGDLNSKIGVTMDDEHIRNIVGRYGIGERNSRGDRLIQFCVDNDLTIMNSMYKHHPRRLYTWISPGGRHRNQIDYIMIKHRWKTSISQCKTRPSADCGSDHQLLFATLKQKFKACARIRNKRISKIKDTQQFKSQCNERL